MANFLRTKKIYLLLIYLISFSNQAYTALDLFADINNNELAPLKFKIKYLCDHWYPSLLNSILITPDSPLDDYQTEYIGNINIANVFYKEASSQCTLYEFLFNKEYNVYLGLCNFNDFNCYYGLAPSVPKTSTGLEKDQYNLLKLKNNNDIKEFIFSFDKWEIKDDKISSTLYLGGSHEHFNSNEGYVGNCNITDKEYWSCSFKEIIFNNVKISLAKDDKSSYNIYFASETNNIVFPNAFKKIFTEASNGKCEIKTYSGYHLSCENLTEGEYIPLKIIDEDMNITAEIDYTKNYCKDKETNKYKTRIIFEPIKYIIFPLMMFKKYHVQFDGVNKKISFFTKDNSILEVPEKPVEGKSSILTVFLVILIILVVLGIAFLVYHYIGKLRGNSLEKSINECNKYEDDFRNINDNSNFD